MGGLIVADVLAVVGVCVGFFLAFRQGLICRALGRRQADGNGPGSSEGVHSALRIAGVMLMAFSFMTATFAHLIAYFTAHSPTA